MIVKTRVKQLDHRANEAIRAETFLSVLVNDPPSRQIAWLLRFLRHSEYVSSIPFRELVATSVGPNSFRGGPHVMAIPR